MMVRRLLRFALLLALLLPLALSSEAVAYKSAVEQVTPDDDGELPMNGAGSHPNGEEKSEGMDFKDKLFSLMPFLEKLAFDWRSLRILDLFQ